MYSRSVLPIKCSTLIFATYSVAKSAGDPKYLATVCRDIAQSLMTDLGRSACSAQDEVLQYCDRLFALGKVTENQLLYLRHMVLTRDENIATLYDNFQRHQNTERFVLELFRLANTHPRWMSSGEDEEQEREDDEREDDDSELLISATSKYASAVHPDPPPAAVGKNDRASLPPSDSNRGAVITGIVNLMARTGSITASEADILKRLVTIEDDYVIAAYDLFCQDGDVEELEDTLLRCARLELSRRANADYSQRVATRSVAKSESEDSQPEPSNVSSERRYVESFLTSVGVRNTWDSSVPERFIVAVFATAQKGLLTMGQARALCDLYQAQYDLVLAAWEVFTVQSDVPDLMDTLLRIVRGLSFSDSGELMSSNSLNDDDDDEDYVPGGVTFIHMTYF